VPHSDAEGCDARVAPGDHPPIDRSARTFTPLSLALVVMNAQSRSRSSPLAVMRAQIAAASVSAGRR